MAPDIFYVEDDPDYAFVMEEALGEVNQSTRLAIIEDGINAIKQLEELAGERKKPKLILLDLNLPGLSGIDILKRIKEMPTMKHVPVILFSTSDNPKDVKASYEFGANAYVTKPDGYHNLMECIRSMHQFWFNPNTITN